MIDSCVGLDPGLAVGMCFLDYEEGRLVGRTLLQADAGSAVHVLKGLLGSYYDPNRFKGRRVASVESWADGPPAGGKDAKVTRQLVMELAEACEMYGYVTLLRNAGQVKPWASDKRLEKAQLDGDSAFHGKLRDAYDAARHCLFGAVEAGITDDPLRRDARSRT